MPRQRTKLRIAAKRRYVPTGDIKTEKRPPIEETVVRRLYPGELAQSALTGSIWAVGSEAKTSSGLRASSGPKQADIEVREARRRCYANTRTKNDNADPDNVPIERPLKFVAPR